jgi:signal transduction histidine kinase
VPSRTLGRARQPRSFRYAAAVRKALGTRWLAVSALAALGVVAIDAAGLLSRLELPVRDVLLQVRPQRTPANVAAVVIDERALAAEGPWPWPRARLAEIVDAIGEAGAAGVAVDVLLVESRPGDDRLAASLRRLPAVLVTAPGEEGAGWLEPPPVLHGAARIAHGLFELDHDGVMRRLSATKQVGGTGLVALPFAAGALLTPQLAVPVGRTVSPGFRSSPRSVPQVGAVEVLRGEDRAELRGRVAFIGLTAAGLGDRVMTPVTDGPRPDPGVLVHAAVTQSLLTGDLIHTLPPFLAVLPAGLLMVAAGAFAGLGGAGRLGGHLFLLLAPTTAGAGTLAAAGLALPVVALTVLVVATVLAVEARIALLAWRRAGSAAALLSVASGNTSQPRTESPEARLDLVEELATAAARRRLAEEEARGVAIHELKTPLTSVRGLSQMLRDMELSVDERRHAAGLLATEAERLEGMIVQLLELERLPRRTVAEAGERIDLSALLATRVELLGRGHERAVRAEIEPGLVAWGDRRLLERVVDNLLANAFKFSPPDTTVGLAARRGGRQVVVEVRDRGEGIAPGEQERIFQRFTRGKAAERRQGLGLGLALVREVITWHGGHVAVSSTPGRGSVFTVVLPAETGEDGVGEDPGR